MTEWTQPTADRHEELLAAYASFLNGLAAAEAGDVPLAFESYKRGRAMAGEYWPWVVVIAAHGAAKGCPIEELGLAELDSISNENCCDLFESGEIRAAADAFEGGWLARSLYVGMLASKAVDGERAATRLFGAMALAMIRAAQERAAMIALRDLALLAMLGASAEVRVRRSK